MAVHQAIYSLCFVPWEYTVTTQETPLSYYISLCLLLLCFSLTILLGFSSALFPLHPCFPSWCSLLVKYVDAGRPKLGGSAEERLQLLRISCLFYHNTTACLLGFFLGSRWASCKVRHFFKKMYE